MLVSDFMAAGPPAAPALPIALPGVFDDSASHSGDPSLGGHGYTLHTRRKAMAHWDRNGGHLNSGSVRQLIGPSRATLYRWSQRLVSTGHLERLKSAGGYAPVAMTVEVMFLIVIYMLAFPEATLGDFSNFVLVRTNGRVDLSESQVRKCLDKLEASRKRLRYISVSRDPMHWFWFKNLFPPIGIRGTTDIDCLTHFHSFTIVRLFWFLFQACVSSILSTQMNHILFGQTLLAVLASHLWVVSVP